MGRAPSRCKSKVPISNGFTNGTVFSCQPPRLEPVCESPNPEMGCNEATLDAASILCRHRGSKLAGSEMVQARRGEITVMRDHTCCCTGGMDNDEYEASIEEGKQHGCHEPPPPTDPEPTQRVDPHFEAFNTKLSLRSAGSARRADGPPAGRHSEFCDDCLGQPVSPVSLLFADSMEQFRPRGRPTIYGAWTGGGILPEARQTNELKVSTCKQSPIVTASRGEQQVNDDEQSKPTCCSNTGSSFAYTRCLSHCLNCGPPSAAGMTTEANIYNHQHTAINQQKQQRRQRRQQINQIRIICCCRTKEKDSVEVGRNQKVFNCEPYLSAAPAPGSLKQPETCVTLKSILRIKPAECDKKDLQLKQRANVSYDMQTLSMNQFSYKFIDSNHNINKRHLAQKTGYKNNIDNKQIDASGGPDLSKMEKVELEPTVIETEKRDKENAGSHRNGNKVKRSCFCRVILPTLNFLFPFFTSFGNYSLPADLLTDVISGFTVAIMHIPQGMAYGLLAGVEPIYGLYVSLVPVIIMAFMSKSPHISYGTFAVISILLANCTESIRQAMRQEYGLTGAAQTNLTNATTISEFSTEIGSTILQLKHQQNLLNTNENNQELRDALVITNNHKPSDPGQQLLKNLLNPQLASEASYEDQSIWSAPDATLPTANITMPTNIEILTCICLIAGLIQIAMALMRLGVFSLVFSDQLVSSFTTASAVHVATSQLGSLFDLSVPRVPYGPFKVCRIWLAFVTKFLDGFNHYTALLTLISLLYLICVKEFVEPRLKRRYKTAICIPSELILMLVLIICSWYWQFLPDYGIIVVGDVPTGLPLAKAPRLDLVPWVLQDALTVAIVSFAMNLSLAQVCAKKFKYRLNSNQELFALGTSNLISSFFSCFPCASSLSRTAVQTNLNSKSQISSLVSCAIVVSIICYFAPFFHDLPRSTLSCIIVIALKGILIQAKDLYENWRLSKLDALVWFATFMFVIAFDVTYGLVFGIITSLSTVFYRLITPNYSILGQVPDTEIYVAKDAFVECNEIDHVQIFRFNSSLCYLNREMFKSSIERLLQSTNNNRKQNMGLFRPQQPKQEPSKNGNPNDNNIQYLIIDCSALAFCDYSGVSALIEIIDELEEKNMTVFLASCSLKLIRMIEKLKRTNLLERNIYPSITDAVNQTRYLRNFAMRSSLASPSDPVDHTCLKSVISDAP